MEGTCRLNGARRFDVILLAGGNVKWWPDGCALAADIFRPVLSTGQVKRAKTRKKVTAVTGT